MLVIERTLGSTIRIGSDISIKVTDIPGSRRVRLGLQVPRGTLVWREEAGEPDHLKPALPHKATLNVLVVEDDAAHARLIEKGFERAGSAVTRLVNTADDALEMLQNDRGTTAMPNLIVVDLDLGLGRMDGIELIEEIKRDPGLSGVPTVMLSAVASHKHITAAFEAGANAFLPKTDDYTEFSNLIIRVAEFWRQNLPPQPIRGTAASVDVAVNEPAG